MLALTRRAGECVWIGDDIRVVVHSVENGHVRLAFDAPIDVKILREELLPASVAREASQDYGHGLRSA